MSAIAVRVEPGRSGPGFIISVAQRAITVAVILVPLVGVALAGLEAWRHGLSPITLMVAVLFYAIAGHGVTVGFHRYLTHGSFTAARPLRIALAVAGSLAIEGGPIGWVAVHRRHHQFSDGPGDPHSPYRYGTGLGAQLRGLGYAHLGWMFARTQSDPQRYAPDLLADPDIVAVDRLFPVIAAASVFAPFAIGWALTGRVGGGLGLLLWAGLARIALLHHITWSVNSICHLFGRRPYRTRGSDRARNFWPLAVISMGESWHNLHHADPTCARHGVDRFQLDSSARLVRWLELAGWASNVHWPQRARLTARRCPAAPAPNAPAAPIREGAAA